MGIRLWRIILASALIRLGGGYNSKPVSKAKAEVMARWRRTAGAGAIGGGG